MAQQRELVPAVVESLEIQASFTPLVSELLDEKPGQVIQATLISPEGDLVMYAGDGGYEPGKPISRGFLVVRSLNDLNSSGEPREIVRLALPHPVATLAMNDSQTKLAYGTGGLMYGVGEVFEIDLQQLMQHVTSGAVVKDLSIEVRSSGASTKGLQYFGDNDDLMVTGWHAVELFERNKKGFLQQAYKVRPATKVDSNGVRSGQDVQSTFSSSRSEFAIVVGHHNVFRISSNELQQKRTGNGQNALQLNDLLRPHINCGVLAKRQEPDPYILAQSDVVTNLEYSQDGKFLLVAGVRQERHPSLQGKFTYSGFMKVLVPDGQRGFELLAEEDIESPVNVATWSARNREIMIGTDQFLQVVTFNEGSELVAQDLFPCDQQIASISFHQQSGHLSFGTTSFRTRPADGDRPETVARIESSKDPELIGEAASPASTELELLQSPGGDIARPRNQLQTPRRKEPKLGSIHVLKMS